jgi:peptidoglycan/xylan/chitin deacetylase (PgdA/CDA1 family)
MIGVIADPKEESAVREFFELFKVPWEFFRSDRRYEVVICAGDARLDGLRAKLVLVYAGEKTVFDANQGIQVEGRLKRPTLLFGGKRLPIYGEAVTFHEEKLRSLVDETSGQSITRLDRLGKTRVVRVGYDLFREVQTLLVKGQPVENAGYPALELHIALLRDLITGSGIPLLEIPPVPDGYPFIVCLTHDIDHASLRRHRFDHTMFGFLYRATLGSLVDAVRGKISAGKVFTNWLAAAKLPFVYLGLAKDFWYDFDRYLELEQGRPSTFFVIPFAGRPGHSPRGPAPKARASAYGITDITQKIGRLMRGGCEIGLHGIDAWRESSSGREELRQVSNISPTAEGVRMHWLYRDEKSPGVLEAAGFSYDSTVGYNETIGYRAGTGQAFKPLQATHLLELPMHVMDTALFYPSYLDLSQDEARKRLVPLLENAVRHGGALTVNWHDRSIAPERLWDDFYVRLLEELTHREAWFSTAGQAVAWFRKRRTATFESVSWDGRDFRATISADESEGLPGLRLRFHRGRMLPEDSAESTSPQEGYVDIGFNHSIHAQFQTERSQWISQAES